MKIKLTIFCLLFVGTNGIFAGQQSNGSLHPTPLVNKSSLVCGYFYLDQHIDEIIKNTQLRYPNLPRQLLKPAKVEHEVGDTLKFYTINFKSNSYEQISALCRYKSDKTYIFVGLNEWDSEKVTQDDVDQLYQAFEVQTPVSSVDPTKGIREILESTYGPPPNKSGDGYVYILIQDIKDTYDPGAGINTYIAGYFSPTDQSNTSYSNKKDMIYVDCDPSDPSKNLVHSFVAHEYQHLIHYGFDPDEEKWVNEGASEYSEALCGYGLRVPNRFLLHPERSLNTFGEYLGDILIDYEKVALWTYYLGEKFGRELVGEIVRNPGNSVAGVRNALTARQISLSFEDIFSNFVVANYADDPSLGDNGYYGYQNIYLPTLPEIKNTHQVYPVSEQNSDLQQYAADYFQFEAKDPTALLNFSIQSGGELRAIIYQNGNESKVDEVTLDSQKKGTYSLAAIGKTASEIVLIPASLNSFNSYTYSVSSELEDITAPVIVSGPRESLTTENSVVIYWNTDEPATSIVRYGQPGDYNSVAGDSLNFVTSHQVVLSNLAASTTYHYRVESKDNYSNGPVTSVDFTFTTSGSLNEKTIVTVKQAHSYGYQGKNLVYSSDGALHLVYHEIVNDRRFVYHTKTTDNGVNWSTPNQIDNTLFYGGMPSIAIDSQDRFHVVWHAEATSGAHYKIYYSRSDDGGDSWTSPQSISKTVTANDQLYAAITVDDHDNPYVVWNTVLYGDANVGDIYFNSSSDGGTTWSNDQQISSSTEHRCFVPTIDFTSDGTAYVVYVDGNFDQQTRNVFYVSSQDQQQWTTQAQISNSGVLYDALVSFVIDADDRIHLVYSDNYTPGDIRIMYTYFDQGNWQAPVPITPATDNRNANYPNIAADDADDLYLVYRLANSSSVGKVIQKQPVDDTPYSLSKILQNDNGDILFKIYRNNNWSPATYLVDDSNDSNYPELPKKINNGLVDLIWMNESTSSSTLNYLQFNTKSSTNKTPPKITNVFPQNGATDVTYFKAISTIFADFDKRIVADSLAAENVTVTSAANGPVTGQIMYDESLRRMNFIPAQNLLPNDEITVHLSGNITSEAGVGLDGNGDNQAQGSPTDDYTWSFQTQDEDLSAPSFTIGVLQNPVITRYLDVYVVASEYLSRLPELVINQDSVSMVEVSREDRIFKGNYRIKENGTIELSVNGEDLAGNSGSATKNFSAQLILAQQGGRIHSTDQKVELVVPASAINTDMFFTLMSEFTDSSQEQSVLKNSNSNRVEYKISPTSLVLNRAARLNMNLPQLNESQTQVFHLERKAENGTWETVASEIHDGRLVADVQKLGTYRLVQIDAEIPSDYVLLQNYPNPFSIQKNKTTTFLYKLPVEGKVQLTVFNLLGQKVRTLVEKEQKPGTYSITWDGTDDLRQIVASGIYFYRLHVNQKIITRKILIIH